MSISSWFSRSSIYIMYVIWYNCVSKQRLHIPVYSLCECNQSHLLLLFSNIVTLKSLRSHFAEAINHSIWHVRWVFHHRLCLSACKKGRERERERKRQKGHRGKTKWRQKAREWRTVIFPSHLSIKAWGALTSVWEFSCCAHCKILRINITLEL